jgi:hypothetical protein
MQRPVNVREPRKTFLIVCEGEKTEPQYFRSFRVPTKTIKVVGTGYNTRSLVEWAIELQGKQDYDQVWCVFDRDSFSVSNFNDALTLAEAENIKVAYSNEAFELWYLLHFHYYNTGISRSDYSNKLSKLLKFKYQKNFPGMYDLLFEKQPTAIKNAKKLLRQYKSPNPAKDNPSTTVHQLVEELNRFLV